MFGKFGQGFGTGSFDAGAIEWHRMSFSCFWMPVTNLNEVSASESFPWSKASNCADDVHGTGVVGILANDYLGSWASPRRAVRPHRNLRALTRE